MREDEGTIERLNEKGQEFVSQSMALAALRAIGPMAVKYMEVSYNDPIGMKLLLDETVRVGLNPPMPPSKEDMVLSALPVKPLHPDLIPSPEKENEVFEPI